MCWCGNSRMQTRRRARPEQITRGIRGRTRDGETMNGKTMETPTQTDKDRRDGGAATGVNRAGGTGAHGDHADRRANASTRTVGDEARLRLGALALGLIAACIAGIAAESALKGGPQG